jgi:fucose 4-O-acetylase-like acetyltransferase
LPSLIAIGAFHRFFPAATHSTKGPIIGQENPMLIAHQANSDRRKSTSNPAPTAEREILWDYARGIGILLVVYGHVLRGLNSADIVPDAHWIMASDFAIYTFHMPLFFLLAGMNVEKGLARGGFLRGKLSTIVYPYLLWTLLQGLVQVAMAGSANQPFHLADLGMAVLWQPLGQFWFLYALFLCHVFVFLTTANRFKVALFALLAHAAGQYFEWGMLTLSFKFFLFYAVGLITAGHLKSAVERSATPAGLLATLACTGIAIYAAKELGDFQAPSSLPAAFLGMLLVLQVSALLARSRKMPALMLLGLASMPIYLAHILAASGARIVLSKLGIGDIGVHLVLGSLLGIAFPLALLYVAYRFKQERLAGFTSGAAVFGLRA